MTESNLLHADFMHFNSMAGVLANGQRVFHRNSKGPTYCHIDPSVLVAALSLIDPSPFDDVKDLTIKFPKIVGQAGVVCTTSKDSIFWAKRTGRSHYSRFVKNRQKTPTDSVTLKIVRKRETPEEWLLLHAFFGESVPRDDIEPLPSYWDNHAYIDHAYSHNWELLTVKN